MYKNLAEEISEDFSKIVETAKAANPVAKGRLWRLLYTLIREITFPPDPPLTAVDHQSQIMWTLATEFISPFIDSFSGQKSGTARSRMLKIKNEKTERYFEITGEIMDILKELSYDDLLSFFRDWKKNNSPNYVINKWKEKIKPKGYYTVIEIVRENP